MPGGLASTVRSWIVDAAQAPDRATEITVVEATLVDNDIAFVTGVETGDSDARADSFAKVVLIECRGVEVGNRVRLQRCWSADIDGLGRWIVGLEWSLIH